MCNLGGVFLYVWLVGRSAGAWKQLAALSDAAANPSRYVLKPQREGGGNNFYKSGILMRDAGPARGFNMVSCSEISAALTGFDRETLSAYVLMSHIDTAAVSSWHVRSAAAESVLSVSELGIYSVFLSDGRSAAILNDYVGYLLRTKVCAAMLIATCVRRRADDHAGR
jgi:hypothetical protein